MASRMMVPGLWRRVDSQVGVTRGFMETRLLGLGDAVVCGSCNEGMLAKDMLHGDPLDRMLVAQAMVEGMVLVTGIEGWLGFSGACCSQANRVRIEYGRPAGFVRFGNRYSY